MVGEGSVKLRGGRVVRMKATQLDDKGTVHLVASEMLADNVEHGIVVSLARRGQHLIAVASRRLLDVAEQGFHTAADLVADLPNSLDRLA